MDSAGIRRSYDEVAPTYAERFLHELEGKPTDRALLERFASSTGDPVLEIGCGPGQIGAFVRSAGRRVVGLDLSERMAGLAATRLDSIVVADMRALPFADACVGGIVAFYSLIHLERGEVVGALQEMHRVLRPGGRALVSAHEGDGIVEVDDFLGRASRMRATLFALGELIDLAAAAGLEVVDAVRRDPYPTEGQTVRLYVELQRDER